MMTPQAPVMLRGLAALRPPTRTTTRFPNARRRPTRPEPSSSSTWKSKLPAWGQGAGSSWGNPCLRDGWEGVLDVESAGADLGTSGDCAFVNPLNVAELLVALAVNPGAAGPEWQGLNFTASVRRDQNEYVSIGRDESFDVTTGGLSIGAGRDGHNGKSPAEAWSSSNRSFRT